MTEAAKHELVVERVFDAPRELVFQAWSSVENMSKWASVKDQTTPHMEMDFRVGGSYRTCLRSDDGAESWVGGRYLEIVQPDRIVFTHAWDDESGDPGHETIVTITFEADGGNKDRTRVRLHQAEFDSAESAQGHSSGWSEVLDSLTSYLKSQQR